VTYSVDQVGSIRRVTLAGRLDADGVKAVEADFHAAATAEPNVIVDLTAVPFLASLGIRMLVAASQDQEKLGGKLVLVSPDEITTSFLKTTGIDQIIPVRDTADEAALLF
jgi:stage II sporulation protein AA (anti-sigma F factor antagonist)